MKSRLTEANTEKHRRMMGGRHRLMESGGKQGKTHWDRTEEGRTPRPTKTGPALTFFKGEGGGGDNQGANGAAGGRCTEGRLYCHSVGVANGSDDDHHSRPVAGTASSPVEWKPHLGTECL